MDPVIIMVGRNDEGVQDLEVMPDIPAEELADAITAAFGWSGTYDIQINGKLLGARQTLAEVDAWDGSVINLVVSTRPVRVKIAPKSADGYRVLKVSPLAENKVTPNPSVQDKKTLSATKNDQSVFPVKSEIQSTDASSNLVEPVSPIITLLSSTVKTGTKRPNPPKSSRKSEFKS